MRFSFEKKDFVEQDITPEKLAVIGDDRELSWRQFESEVNNLCGALASKGLTNLKYPVAVYGHKSASMLVAMYALMKLKIAYIPIDIIYPDDRVLRILAISNCEVMIDTTGKRPEMEKIALFDLSAGGLTAKKELAQHQQEQRPADPLVYTIFTSGSTGEPKGVQITTEAVQSFLRWMTTDFGFTPNDIFINTAILSFDLSVFEVMTFGALGATLLLNNKETTGEPKLFMSRIHKYHGSVWVSTPSFALLYARMGHVPELSTLRSFLFCGEVLPHSLAKALVANFPNARVINTYGPTEATVATTIVVVDEAILQKYDPLPVGRSKPESQLLIEDQEIIIVGPNVSIGYLNNDELNKAKFTTVNGQRAFKTGDQGYLQDGMLFFHGRNDDLVKLHGYRIELNEITSHLNNLPYVLQGATIALKRDGIVKKIVSLVQLDPAAGLSVNPDVVKQDLAKSMPLYMVPSDIKFIEKIPLNQNGKADKQLLTQIYLEG